MIIYVNIDKTTGEITVNNDMYPNTDVVQFNPNNLEDTENNTKFEIAFNTTSFENKMFPNNHPLPQIDNINGHTN
jgi:hypothetical protein